MIDKRVIKNIIYLISVLLIYLFIYLYNNHLLPFITSSGEARPHKVEEQKTLVSTSTEKGIYLIGNYTVSRITDGDTVHVVDVSGKEDTVRLLVVNTPEIHNAQPRQICLGNLAKEFTSKNLLGKDVLLYGDNTQPKRDKYNRMLAYIKVGTTTDFFNDLLMQTGNAKIYRSTPPGILYTKYLEYQTKAQKQNIGMWNLQLCN